MSDQKTQRTMLDHLVSEAAYLIRESVARPQKTVVAQEEGSRSEVLAHLIREAGATDDLIPASVSSGNSGRKSCLVSEGGLPPEGPLLFGTDGQSSKRIFPMAYWSDSQVELFREPGADTCQQLLKVCVVGIAGRDSLVAKLLEGSLVIEKGKSPVGHLVTPTRQIALMSSADTGSQDLSFLSTSAVADIVLLVLAADGGLTTRERRHLLTAALLGVPHILVAVDGMDRVEYQPLAYQNIEAEIELIASSFEIKSLSIIPVSALDGDNILASSARMPWFEGRDLLSHLDSVNVATFHNPGGDLRLPVQWVKGRLIMGRIASGSTKVGDTLCHLPSGEMLVVKTLKLGARGVETAFAGDSIALTFEKDPEVVRGELLVDPKSLPNRSSEIDAILIWLSHEPQKEDTTYLVHHGSREVKAHVSEVVSILSTESLAWQNGHSLRRHDIGRVQVTTAEPLFFDSASSIRSMGVFAVLDAETSAVLGVGIMRGPVVRTVDVTSTAERLVGKHVVKDPTLVPKEARQKSYGHRAAVLWFTGLSGSGKSTVAKAVEKRLYDRRCHTLFLDGDNVRTGLSGDLGFTQEDRTESTRRVAELAALAYEQGQIVICSFISGTADARDFVRSLLDQGDYLEFFVNCPLEVCRSRDPKKLYERADAGELLSFSGVSLPYEAPENPDLELRSDQFEVDILADRVLDLLEQRQVLKRVSH